MERLTVKTEDGYITRPERLQDGKIIGDSMIRNKLGELEDKQEQGLLVILPCKEGTIVWQVRKTITGTRYVDDGYDHLGCRGHEESIWGYEKRKIPFSINYISEVGKTIFLTEPEADEALEKKKGFFIW